MEQAPSPDDRRKVIVRLTEDGLALVDEVAPGHLATEEEILGGLSERPRANLAQMLRRLLLDLGDAG